MHGEWIAIAFDWAWFSFSSVSIVGDPFEYQTIDKNVADRFSVCEYSVFLWFLFSSCEDDYIFMRYVFFLFDFRPAFRDRSICHYRRWNERRMREIIICGRFWYSNEFYRWARNNISMEFMGMGSMPWMNKQQWIWMLFDGDARVYNDNGRFLKHFFLRRMVSIHSAVMIISFLRSCTQNVAHIDSALN